MKYNLFLLLLVFANQIFAQQTEIVDFKSIDAEISIAPFEGQVSGNVTYRFELLVPTDSIFIDAKNMDFSRVQMNGKKVEFSTTDKKLWIYTKAHKAGNHKLNFTYQAKPLQAMYFVGWNEKNMNQAQVWTQGQGKETSHWLPSFDDVNEKMIFNFTVDFPKDYAVIANGALKQKQQLNDSVTRWKYKMQQPMSSYLAAIAVGDYSSTAIKSKNGTPIELYYTQAKQAKVEPTYRHTKRIFDFLEDEIGVTFPWQNYKQVPVRDFLYAGMENTSLTIFSDVFVVDSVGFLDRNYVSVNAHEMAHQWFGNLITATSGKHHWLQEGFATYYALLAEREIFGEDYFYWKLYESANQLKEQNDSGKGEALLSTNASSLTYYQKGAWALHMLREKIGDKAFKKAVKSYLEKYKFRNVTTTDFIAEAEAASGLNLDAFVAQWLQQQSFASVEAFRSLEKSQFMQKYFSLAALKSVSLHQKYDQLEKALNFPVNDYLGQEAVIQLIEYTNTEAISLYKKAFETNNLLVRQTIAMTMADIPQQLKPNYESLLEDDSYLTKEAALYNLWVNYPEDRKKYLDFTEGIEGFSDKNIRILWLTLHLSTPNYQADEKSVVYKELAAYTSSQYAYQVRQNAFGYLYQLNAFNEQNLKDLVESCFHQVWRYRSFARNLLQELMQQEAYREKFVALAGALPQKEREFIKEKLK